MIRKPKTHKQESIPLRRNGQVVSTLTGAFGQSLRETRLTALLGYLMALEPSPFLELFGFVGEAQQVSLETRHEDGRSDILVETSRGNGVIEAKTNAADPLSQSKRYPARWVALLTQRTPLQKQVGRTRYVNWQALADVLTKVCRSGSPIVRMLSADLLTYLAEHHMTRKQDSVEIYAREINAPISLELFLKGRVYTCKYEASSRMSKALYFAPHFGAAIVKTHPGVSLGISYIARILTLGYASTWQEFEKLMVKERTRTWWNTHRDLLKKLRRRWSVEGAGQRTVLLLEEPRLAFNPPVRKVGLQKGKGFLSKRFFSFDTLFEAWGK